MWLILQLILAIVYFAGIPALASVPTFLFFVPLIIWVAVCVFIGLAGIIVAAARR